MDKPPETGHTAQPPNIHVRRVTRAHIVQSLLAGGYIFLTFFALHTLRSNLAVASLGASTFIAFSFPQAKSSRPRYLIGGYTVGAAAGVLFHYLITWLETLPGLPLPPHIPGCALAMFCCIFILTVFDFEHPPAVALTMAVAMSDQAILLGISAVLCVCVLSGVKHLLRGHLVNL